MSHPRSNADLRCEYRVNPLGIDNINPRLSWKFEASDAMVPLIEVNQDHSPVRVPLKEMFHQD